MVDAYANLSDVLERITALEADMKTVSSIAKRMRMSRVDLVRLQDGDLLILRVQRPLATSESQMIVDGFKDLFRQLGKHVELAVVCGHDEVKLEVVRASGSDL